jgi:hypothetical protein
MEACNYIISKYFYIESYNMNPNFNNTNNLSDQNLNFGIVESITDPSGLHRSKVRIIGIHNDNRKLLPTNDLPWSIVANSPNSTGKHNLKIGNFVVCTFLDSDYQQPIVLYSLFSRITTSNIQYNSILDTNSPGSVLSQPNKIPNQTLFNKVIPAEVLAKSQQTANIANPLGQNNNVPIANGKNGGVGMFADIQREVISLANIFKHVELYDVDDIVLAEDIDEGIGFIPLDRTNGVPTAGIIKIDNEIITYSGLASSGLTNAFRGSPDRWSFTSTTNAVHTKGVKIEWLYPVVKNDKAPLFYSKLTKQAIDFAKEIKKRMNVISGYITWLLSEVSGTLTQLLSELILSITQLMKSPVALVGKVIVDALLSILSQVLCVFSTDTVDSLVALIEKTITDEVTGLVSAVYQAGDFIEKFITSCSNKIFDAILQFASIIQSIGNLTTNVTKLFPGAVANSNALIKDATSGEYKLSIDDITKVGSIVGVLLSFLGVGCSANIGQNVSTVSDYQGTTGCTTTGYYPDGITCSSNPDIIEQLNGIWRPLPPFITTHDFGGGLIVERDATPGSERTLITSPAGTYTEVINDGTSKTVITKDNYQLVLNDNFVEIKGNCFMKVDGDFGLKVSGNFDVEVGKQFRMSVGGASQITYGGSHTTNYSGDSKLNAVNKLSLTGSQIGLAASGVADIAAGVFSVLSNETNISSLGSLNLMSLHSTHISALTCREIHSGTVDKLVVGNDNKVNLGNYTTNIVGTKNSTITGLNTLNNIGTYLTNSNVKIESVTGLNQSSSNMNITNSNLKIDNIAGASFNYAQGISIRNTQGGVNMDI